MFFLHVKNVRYKILSKYIYMGSCFEEFITRNTTVQSKFNLDVYFVNYRFFKFTTNHDITVLFIYTCMHLYVLEGVLRPARGLGPNARPLAAKNVPTRMTIERPAAFTGIRFGVGVAYSSSIRHSQQDYLLYTQFFRTNSSSISSFIHSIHLRPTYHFI
jgi:hypothetical protein